MRSWLRDHGLLLVNLALFLIFFGGMVLTGVRVYNGSQLEHGEAAVNLIGYLGTGNFIEATFENWESEFLQMGMYVVLTAYLFQRGSSESKPLDEPAPQDEDPRDHRDDAGRALARSAAVAGSWHVYERSLGHRLLRAVPGFGGAARGRRSRGVQRGGSWRTAVRRSPPWRTSGRSQFWFESFQNWQSEFLAVAAIVGLSVYLRQRGSAESKPVAEPHRATGA